MKLEFVLWQLFHIGNAETEANKKRERVAAQVESAASEIDAAEKVFLKFIIFVISHLYIFSSVSLYIIGCYGCSQAIGRGTKGCIDRRS